MTADNCGVKQRALRALAAGLEVAIYLENGPAEPAPQAALRAFLGAGS